MIRFTLKKKTIDGEDRVFSVDMKYICAVISFASAAYMGFNNIDGWGWFLFVGVLCLG